MEFGFFGATNLGSDGPNKKTVGIFKAAEI